LSGQGVDAAGQQAQQRGQMDSSPPAGRLSGLALHAWRRVFAAFPILSRRCQPAFDSIPHAHECLGCFLGFPIPAGFAPPVLVTRVSLEDYSG
jgi:hypothetical protein